MNFGARRTAISRRMEVPPSGEEVTTRSSTLVAGDCWKATRSGARSLSSRTRCAVRRRTRNTVPRRCSKRVPPPPVEYGLAVLRVSSVSPGMPSNSRNKSTNANERSLSQWPADGRSTPIGLLKSSRGCLANLVRTSGRARACPLVTVVCNPGTRNRYLRGRSRRMPAGPTGRRPYRRGGGRQPTSGKFWFTSLRIGAPPSRTCPETQSPSPPDSCAP